MHCAHLLLRCIEAVPRVLHFQREPLFEFGGLLRPPPLCALQPLPLQSLQCRGVFLRGRRLGIAFPFVEAIPNAAPLDARLASLLVYPACRLRRGPRVSHLQAPREELAKLALPEDA